MFGLRLQAPQTVATAADPFIELAIELRARLRNDKLFALADTVRNALTEAGITLEDHKGTTTWQAPPTLTAETLIDLLLNLRASLRSEKQFELADHLRDSLTNNGLQIEDYKGGVTWRWQ